MNDFTKSKEKLIEELYTLRRQIQELRVQEKERKEVERELNNTLYELSIHQEELRTQNEELRIAKSELEESHTRYINLFDFAPVGYVTFDPNGVIREINLTATEMLGRKRSLIVGKPMHLYVSNRYHNDLSSHFRGIFSGLTLCNEIELVHSSGKTFQAEFKSVPIKNERDEIIYCRTTISDITERKKTEEELRKLSRAVEQSPSVVVITDIEGNIEYVNPKFTTLTGYSIEEVKGKNPRILKSGKTSQEEYKKLWDTILSGGEWRGEFHNIKKNGESYWESASISSIKDHNGTITHFLAVKEDITEKKQIEEHLRESEELHRIILNNISDAVFITDGEGVFTFICPRVDIIFVYTFTEVQEMGNISSLLGHNLFNREKLRVTGEIENIECDITDKNNKTHSLLINVKKVSIRNGTVLYTCHDITELKKADRKLKKIQTQIIQTEKMSALGTMVAGMAHELINPIMGILNFIDYCVKKTLADDERYPILKSAHRETNRCRDIIENLLTFSHMDTESKDGFQKESCIKILDQVFKLLSYNIEKNRIHVIKEYSENIPEIWLRVNGIQQVFINIITNALDAVKESDKKEVHIKVQSTGECIELKISDTGCGIDPNNMRKIFDPFFTTKPPGKGTGLGLSICQSIIKIHEGKLTCESIPGQGTIFVILLPLNVTHKHDNTI